MGKERHKIKERELQGFKYFKAISKMLESLGDVGCQIDRAGNRILHMDQYISLLLLYMFNPICTSLRSLQQASELKKVQKKLGVPRASLGSLSEASTVFDSPRMLDIIHQLGEPLQPISSSSGTHPDADRRRQPGRESPPNRIKSRYAFVLQLSDIEPEGD